MQARVVILIGTTSWGERSLIESGRFYPPSATTAQHRLQYYASRFPITEIDTSFYAIPEPHVVERWVRWTPDTFVFGVKAFRLFTHHRTPLDTIPPDLRPAFARLGKPNLYYHDVPDELVDELWARFRAALAPLHDSGKLGVVLLQFAPWFVRRSSSFEHMSTCASKLADYRVAAEMRNKSWFTPEGAHETLAALEELGLAHVVVDEPQGFASSVPPVWTVTNPEVAVVRLHGHNRAMWHGNRARSAAERYDYFYSRAELQAFVEPIYDVARQADDVHVLFNNCHRDNAQRNAQTLIELVHARLVPRREQPSIWVGH